ncbi:MAG: helix-turn-helix domain-containing protein [Rectinemataceae bacterium]
MDESKPLTLPEAAKYLGFTPGYTYKLVERGQLPNYKPTGGKLYFYQDELKAFVRRNRRAADYELRDRADAILAGAHT